MYVHPPPNQADLLERLANDGGLMRVLSAPADDSRYLHWDKLRRLRPPDGLTSEEWWLRLKRHRMSSARLLPMQITSGSDLSFTLPDRALELLHFTDQHCSGEIASDAVVPTDSSSRRRYLVNALMEEAIRSSQLEGATTSRVAAKELLRSGRKPSDRSERMIVNNYRGMEFIREQAGDRLTPDTVLELHRILTEGTLDDPASAGRLQPVGAERIAVFDRLTNKLLHRPPPAAELPARLQAMCDFANAEGEDGRFIHPVVRAIILHFWLGHDHPFEDGNGRTARTLFYWSMGAHGYWLAEYLAISRILQQAPAQYALAYLYTETDDGDATYFLLHQLEVIKRAVTELHTYLARQVDDARTVELALHADGDLNHRQIALLSHAMRHEDASYTFAEHAATHRVTHETARNDLRAIETRGLLTRRRDGRRIRFVPPSDLRHRLGTPSRSPSK